MTTFYEILLTVQTQHNYYASGISRDFEFYPTAETSEVLKRYGLLFKDTGDGFQVAFKASDQYNTPMVELDTDISLVFAYRLKTPALMNITQVTQKAYNEVYYSDLTTTNTDGTVFYPEPRKVNGLHFSEEFSSDNEQLEVSITNEAGKQLAFESLTGGEVVAENTGDSTSYRFVRQVSLRNQPNGNYTLKRLLKGATEDATTWYLNDELANNRPFGIVKIDLSPSTINYNTTSKYAIEWERRELYWEYHFVFTQDFEDWTFELVDEGPDAVVAPDPTYPAEVEFKLEEVPDDFNEGEKMVVSTKKKMPYYEIPRKYLKLMGEGGDDAIRTLDHLPNPSMHNPTPVIYINV